MRWFIALRFHFCYLIEEHINASLDLPQIDPESRGGGGGSGGGVVGMCRWMVSHFYDLIDYNGVAFSIELLEWGHTFSDFGGKKVLHLYR